MNAKQGTALIADQMAELLATLQADTYTMPLQIFHGSTIGQHFRHILEFYTCLLEGLDCDFVNYGGRRRDPQIEQNPAFALAVLHQTAGRLYEFDEHRLIKVVSEFSDDSSDERLMYQSTVGRELQYAFDHAVHHLAIIRIGLETCFPDVPVCATLGVAPSTLKYRQAPSAEAVHIVPAT
ncbi:MAG TPA: hypothetical protein PKL15_11600 [Saprospiraceae bacterium]|nr:hypothetical protein [Saprospiraceae bacterium]